MSAVVSLTALYATDPQDDKRKWQTGLHLCNSGHSHWPWGFCFLALLLLLQLCAASSLAFPSPHCWITLCDTGPPANQLPAPNPISNTRMVSSSCYGWRSALSLQQETKGSEVYPTCCQESGPPWLIKESNTNHIFITGWRLGGGGRWAYVHTKYFIILTDLVNSLLERGCYILNINIYFRRVIVFSNELFFTFTVNSNGEIRVQYAKFCLQKFFVCPQY